MKKKKLIKAMVGLLDEQGRKRSRRRAELRELIARMQEKETRLAEKTAGEKDRQKRKRSETDLEILRAQIAKGQAALEALDAE